MLIASRASVSVLALTALASTSTAQDNGLPTEWHGTWHGVMHNTVKSGKTMKVPVVFEVLPVQGKSYVVWRTTYGDGDKKVVKDYRLAQLPKHKDRFVVDEQNGVKLNMRKVGDVMHGCFSIKKQIYTARYELRKGTLTFEITVAEPAGDKQPHSVQDYRTTVVQAATLTRKKD